MLCQACRQQLLLRPACMGIRSVSSRASTDASAGSRRRDDAVSYRDGQRSSLRPNQLSSPGRSTPAAGNDGSTSRPKIPNAQLPLWKSQKAALAAKFGSRGGWQPLTKLSPSAMDGVRALHAEDPEKFSTSRLAQRFSVSPESIRRILKSRWQPTDAERLDRDERWRKRGEKLRDMMRERSRVEKEAADIDRGDAVTRETKAKGPTVESAELKALRDRFDVTARSAAPARRPSARRRQTVPRPALLDDFV